MESTESWYVAVYWVVIIITVVVWAAITRQKRQTFDRRICPRTGLHKCFVYPFGPVLGLLVLAWFAVAVQADDPPYPPPSSVYGILLPLGVMLVVVHTIMSSVRLKGRAIGDWPGVAACTCGQVLTVLLLIWSLGFGGFSAVFVSLILTIVIVRGSYFFRGWDYFGRDCSNQT